MSVVGTVNSAKSVMFSLAPGVSNEFKDSILSKDYPRVSSLIKHSRECMLIRKRITLYKKELVQEY